MNGTVQNNVKNILIAGVGGQGTLLANKLMGKCFIGEDTTSKSARSTACPSGAARS